MRGFAVSGLVALSVFMGRITPVHAAVENYALESPHTQVMFSISHMGLSNSYGKFTGYSGTLVIDRDAPEKSTVDVTIKTDSLDLNDKTWNEHVQAKDLLNVAVFPTMTFKSTLVTRTGDKTADMTGDLTLLGITKPVTLQVTFNDAKYIDMTKENRIGFSAKGTLKRSEFGMSHGIPFVGDDVALIIEVEAIRQDAPSEQKE